MAKVFLICGHGENDPGACGNGYQEAERVRTLAKRIKDFGGDNVIVGDTSKNWYARKMINANNIPKDALVLELHMDSASATARGAHVIVDADLEADKYDIALANMITGILPGRSQGIVKRNNLANPNRAQASGINYRLMECGFISNAKDVEIFNSRIDDIAKGILESFDINTINNNEQNHTIQQENVSATYTVQKGDTLYGISKKFGMSVDQLKSINELISNTIYVGQVLKVSANAPAPQPTPQPAPTPAPSGNQIVKDGQVHARNFAASGLVADGIRGANTIKAGIRVLQQAMNLDYKSGLIVDGIWGTKSERALGKHTVRRGETQYMVTALEILLMLKGYNTNGLENPGIFGAGLESAVRKYQADHSLSVDGIAGYKTFKSLIG